MTIPVLKKVDAVFDALVEVPPSQMDVKKLLKMSRQIDANVDVINKRRAIVEEQAQMNEVMLLTQLKPEQHELYSEWQRKANNPSFYEKADIASAEHLFTASLTEEQQALWDTCSQSGRQIAELIRERVYQEHDWNRIPLAKGKWPNGMSEKDVELACSAINIVTDEYELRHGSDSATNDLVANPFGDLYIQSDAQTKTITLYRGRFNELPDGIMGQLKEEAHSILPKYLSNASNWRRIKTHRGVGYYTEAPELIPDDSELQKARWHTISLAGLIFHANEENPDVHYSFRVRDRHYEGDEYSLEWNRKMHEMSGEGEEADKARDWHSNIKQRLVITGMPAQELLKEFGVNPNLIKDSSQRGR